MKGEIYKVRLNLKSLLITLSIALFSALVGYLGNITPTYFITAMAVALLTLELFSVKLTKVKEVDLDPFQLKGRRFFSREIIIHLGVDRSKLLYLLGFSPVISLSLDEKTLMQELKSFTSELDNHTLKLLITPKSIKAYSQVAVTVNISSLLGTFSTGYKFIKEVNWVIYPRELRLREIAETVTRGRGGNFAIKGRRGDHLIGIREYIPGDDPRDISWKHTAKLGKYMVALWAKPSEDVLILPLLRPEDLKEGVGDDLMEIAFSIAHRLHQEEVPFKFVLGKELIGDIETLKERLPLRAWEPSSAILHHLKGKWTIALASDEVLLREAPSGEGIGLVVKSIDEIEVVSLAR